MEKIDLSKLKLASSSITERLKTSGAQMGRTITSKMKEILQSPTPESKIVDEATSESMTEPNWGLNLRICAMISREEYDGAEIVRAIKKKLMVQGKNSVVQLLSLDLLEACASNCDKVFSEVASEKVLEEMVKLIEDSRTEQKVRVRATQLIRGWGESEELKYLPVFNQTYMQLKSRGSHPEAQEDSLLLSPPESYPIPNAVGESGEDNTFFMNYSFQSNEEKKEFLVVTRNSIDILSSILNSEAEPKPLQDELTISMLEKCRESLPVVQGIIESTSNDEVMLFDALNLHDELQLVISKHKEMTVAIETGNIKNENTLELSPDSNTNEDTKVPIVGGSQSETKVANYAKIENTDSNKAIDQEESASGDKSSK